VVAYSGNLVANIGNGIFKIKNIIAYISINNDVLIFTYPTVSLSGTEGRRG
jgi:hypothetical protein